MIILGICLASAIDIALQTVEIKPHLLSTLHMLSLLMFYACVSLLVGRFISTKFPLTALGLERLGIFIAASAFCYAITIPFPLALKCTTWATFVFSLLAIFICNLLF
ncbi:hypothetical protein TIFTF001_027130 [Ficus carica]|uniref:Uncharacterized protein n=1 Tax=Ficus carica TaxID=3494 RepID=A0AA88DME0_FICCA|nr:hypothetical protein TIFTF001_027130 [Ficus carica]